MDDRLADRRVHVETHIEAVDIELGPPPLGRGRLSVGRGQRGTGGADEGAGRQQFAGVGVLRTIEHIEDRRLLHGVAALQHRHIVCDLADDAEVVADPHHGGAEVALQIPDQLDDLRLRRHVQRGGRFVGDQQFRIARHRDRDHHALLLSTGQLVRVCVKTCLGIG